MREYCERGRERAAASLEETRAVLARARSEITPEVLSEAVEVDWRFHDEVVGAMNNGLVEEIYQINALRIRLIRADIRLSPRRRVRGAARAHRDPGGLRRRRRRDGGGGAARAHIGRDAALDGGRVS